jgi:hypothetical protein
MNYYNNGVNYRMQMKQQSTALPNHPDSLKVTMERWAEAVRHDEDCPQAETDECARGLSLNEIVAKAHYWVWWKEDDDPFTPNPVVVYTDRDLTPNPVFCIPEPVFPPKAPAAPPQALVLSQQAQAQVSPPKEAKFLLPLTKKRHRDASDDISSERFQFHQTGQWETKYKELALYSIQRGHCSVSHTNDNPFVVRWVKRQRYQYKLFLQGEPSTMTRERVTALEGLGFCWDSQNAVWLERLQDLKEFRRVNDHCNVSSIYKENQQLGNWVKYQRRQYKLLRDGKASSLSPLRVQDLENLGFEWERRYAVKKAKHC